MPIPAPASKPLGRTPRPAPRRLAIPFFLVVLLQLLAIRPGPWTTRSPGRLRGRFRAGSAALRGAKAALPEVGTQSPGPLATGADVIERTLVLTLGAALAPPSGTGQAGTPFAPGDGVATRGRAGEEEDGLRAYLDTLCRVAHARGASHWCTPGHNRGRTLTDPGAATTPPSPLTGMGGTR